MARRRLAGSVVVITGASSGIGRATALAFARAGARLVLAARHEGALQEVARACDELGALALVVPTDVRDEAAVNELARRAVVELGQIDVWVNNAGVLMVGRIEDAPLDAYRKLIDTNLFGCVHGARAAISRMRGGGVIINVSSMAATIGRPYYSAYASSKWAVRGMSECLRQELLDEDIDVVTVMPASIDTPLFSHAANFSGRAIKPLESVSPVEDAARAIVEAARHPRAEVTVGTVAHSSRVLRAITPTSTFERITARRAEKAHFLRRPAEPTEGNLNEPQPPFTTEGGWRRRGRPLLRFALAAAGVALALPALVVLTRNHQRALLAIIRHPSSRVTGRRRWTR
jgi:NAD(P)-dependent dehydrogenase (short-subunit alcohol dehydrogenase family)